MFILDSDVLRLYLRHRNQQQRLVERIANTPREHLWLTIITVQEGIAGAARFEARDPIRHSEILAGVVRDYSQFQILTWSDPSLAIYRSMPERLKQHNRNDWKIGAFALAHGFTVVTRNTRDFAAIQPAVSLVDWTA